MGFWGKLTNVAITARLYAIKTPGKWLAETASRILVAPALITSYACTSGAYLASADRSLLTNMVSPSAIKRAEPKELGEHDEGGADGDLREWKNGLDGCDGL